MKKLLLGAALGLGILLGSAPVQAQGYVYVRYGPPAPRHEVIPARPGAGYVWVGGYYRWYGGAYVWHPGYWARHDGAWCAGHWVHRPDRGWYWVDGHWC